MTQTWGTVKEHGLTDGARFVCLGRNRDQPASPVLATLIDRNRTGVSIRFDGDDYATRVGHATRFWVFECGHDQATIADDELSMTCDECGEVCELDAPDGVWVLA